MEFRYYKEEKEMAENPILDKWNNRYMSLSNFKQKKIDELKAKRHMTDELIPIKKSKRTLELVIY